jgi:hypothetical protein
VAVQFSAVWRLAKQDCNGIVAREITRRPSSPRITQTRQRILIALANALRRVARTPGVAAAAACFIARFNESATTSLQPAGGMTNTLNSIRASAAANVHYPYRHFLLLAISHTNLAFGSL